MRTEEDNLAEDSPAEDNLAEDRVVPEVDKRRPWVDKRLSVVLPPDNLFRSTYRLRIQIHRSRTHEFRNQTQI